MAETPSSKKHHTPGNILQIKQLKMTQKEYALPQRSRIHVTAANSYVGSVSNAHLFAFAGQYKYTDIIGIFRKLRP
jgi:hypothetical protein